MVRTAALTYGAQGGLRGASFALNEMLRRHQARARQRLRFSRSRPAGRQRPDPDAPAGRLRRADGVRPRRRWPGRSRNVLHLPDHARGAARFRAAELAHLSRSVLVHPAPPAGRRPAAHQAGGRLLEQMGRRGLGVRARSRRSTSSSPIWAALSATSLAWPATACCCGPASWSSPASPSRTRRRADATACMSATARSASPISPGCRPMRAAGGRAPGARSEQRA